MQFIIMRVNGGKRILAIALLMGVVWMGLPLLALASVHTYREQPGQVTYRSRQSLRDYDDRAWQAITFKRAQSGVVQGTYLRLVGFPDVVEVDRLRAVTLLAPTGQQWQLPWEIDPQTKGLPDNVGQYNLQTLLADITMAQPLDMQIPLVTAPPAEIAIAPFIVEEWLQVGAADLTQRQ